MAGRELRALVEADAEAAAEAALILTDLLHAYTMPSRTGEPKAM